jgi:hypothetical protein
LVKIPLEVEELHTEEIIHDLSASLTQSDTSNQIFPLDNLVKNLKKFNLTRSLKH